MRIDLEKLKQKEIETRLFCGVSVRHIMECSDCMSAIQSELARRAGASKSEAKAKSSRENGLKGGRPKKA